MSGSGLDIEGLALRRGGQPILTGLSARLEGGRATALRGPNGVGKSTLLRALAGLLPVAAGDATLALAREGETPERVSLAREPARFQERVLYAGHRDAVKPMLGVAENLALWARLEGTPGRVERALARFGLAGMADRPAAECSAGQTRRLGLARLMVIDRPLWLLDEPTVSLDAASVRLVADLVEEHVRAGGMALIATHADLGLSGAAVLTLAPQAGAMTGAAAGVAADPFLSGDWR